MSFTHLITDTLVNPEGILPFAELRRALARYSQILIIADERVWQLHGQQLEGLHERQSSVFVAPGEAAKSLSEAERCWLACKDAGLDRHACIVSLGGGATTDIAGFVAACYMRGIDVVHLPTTLLAMVDAAIGGKTGVNLADAKNYIGAFHLPRLVVCQLSWLATLPHREYVSGLAEVVKYGLIADADLFFFLEEHVDELLEREMEALRYVVERSIAIKTDVVQRDFKEQNLRQHLNLGHTFAHAIESATNYSQYLHGEAVSIGLCAAARVAEHMGVEDAPDHLQIETLCSALNLPTQLQSPLSTSRLLSLMKRDKKAVCDAITLVLCTEMGRAQVVQVVPEDVLVEVWEEVGADA